MKRWKKLFYLPACLFLLTLGAAGQSLKNSSYTNPSGEKVLRIEIMLPVDINTAWQLFTNDDKLKKWIAPLAHIELKTGGYIITNYDKAKSLADSSAIKLPITCFIDRELLVLKVKLNDHFSRELRDNDENLQEIIQFKKLDEHHSLLVSSMVGWKPGVAWEKAYDFFAKGNEWTYQQLINNYNK